MASPYPIFMDETACKSVDPLGNPALFRRGHFLIISALFIACALVLFTHLGGAALFDPDEGRNAEKAREILLLHDWITPHENFLPVLDKPIFFFWWVALSFRLFGVSEWSARLPSALAGLGSVILIFFFARRFFGLWESLWSGLVLVTSVEFYLLSRIVIFDMTLTFFVTLSLFCFFWGLHAETASRRKLFLMVMYASAGAATLVKGPIGVLLPGIVVLAYLLAGRKLSFLRQLELPLGCILYIVIVVPWYVEMEKYNPGYLHYFLWEENFIRFLTPHFHRTEPWYYFLIVLVVGYLPWTLYIPVVIKDLWKKATDERILFLILWTVLPFLFFSFSNSKLPHYILPIYPPLALLTAISLVRRVGDSTLRKGWLFAVLWLCQLFPIAYFILGSFWPRLLPEDIRHPVAQMAPFLHAFGTSAALIFVVLGVLAWRDRWKKPATLYLCFSTGLVLFYFFVGHGMEVASRARSTKELAKQASPFIGPDNQLVLYDTFFESLPFYLQINRPIWVVWSGEKSSIMGSFYVAEKRPKPDSSHGRILLTFDEFEEEWAKARKNHFLVFVKERNLPLLDRHIKTPIEALVEHNRVLLVTNRPR